MNARIVDERRTTQAAAYFLAARGGHLQEYIILAKLMYLADREALLRLGHTITKGHHFSLKDGPIVSEVNDLLRCGDYSGKYESEGYWDQHITCSHEDGVRLQADPGHDILSKAELGVLKEVQEEHGGKDAETIKRDSHDVPEYTQPREANGRIEITYRRILHEEQIDQAVASRIVRENEAKDDVRSLLASVK